MMPVERLLSKIPTKSYDLNTMFHIRMQEKWVSQYEGLESRKKIDIKMKNVDQVMSLEDQQFENTLRAAWVETHPTNSAETRSGVESPKPTADYTRHVVTVEVHPVPYNKPLKQKVAQKPTTSHVYIGKGHSLRTFTQIQRTNHQNEKPRRVKCTLRIKRDRNAPQRRALVSIRRNQQTRQFHNIFRRSQTVQVNSLKRSKRRNQTRK